MSQDNSAIKTTQIVNITALTMGEIGLAGGS